jgi:fibronectin type 3 domain-containing protein
MQTEDIRLDWDASANASTYHVYRAQADGDMQHVAEVESTNYTDTETEAETTYTYEVTASNEAGEAEDCPTAEVTAIPFFGNPALVAMAALGSVGAVAVARTRHR